MADNTVLIKKAVRHKPVVHILLIAVLGLLAYSNTFQGPFVHDDKRNIVENPIIKDLRYFIEPSKAKDFIVFGPYSRFEERYIGFLSFALNYKIHGLNVTGFHITNLVIHLLNAMLVYFLVILTFRTPYLSGSLLRGHSRLIALFTALVFVSHPIQTQAVTYIVQRFASLTAMFYLLSLVTYIKSRLSAGKGTRLALYGFSLASAVLAMKTKEIAVTLPVVITLYELIFFEGKIKRRLLYLIPLLLTMLIIPLTVVDLDKSVGEIMGEAGEATMFQKMSRFDYLVTEFRVVVTYIRLLLLPVNQNFSYDYPAYRSLLEPPVFLSFLFLLTIFGLGVYLLMKSYVSVADLRVAAFGIFWFFITLSVESSIIPLFPICEHRVYLPSVGAFLALASGVFLLLIKTVNKKIRTAIISSLILIPLVFSYAAYARNSVWESKISLWEDVARKAPEKAEGHYNLALAYASKGLVDKAIEHYQAAVRIKPDYAKAHNNLGLALKAKGLTGRAIEHYRIALSLNPYFAETYVNLGILYKEMGLADIAIKYYKRALRLNPNISDIHYNLGNIYILKGMVSKAMEHYVYALSLNPDDPDVRDNLGIAYRRVGLTAKAEEQFRIAERLRERKR